jgi:predicted nucleic acid-binding protein
VSCWIQTSSLIVQAATQLFELHEQGRFDIFVAAITLINVFYVTRKNKGLDTARRAVDELLAKVGVCPLDQQILEQARKAAFKDYEDAVQHASAVASGLEAIITRNLSDYKTATLAVFSPTDFLAKLGSQPT